MKEWELTAEDLRFVSSERQAGILAQKKLLEYLLKKMWKYKDSWSQIYCRSIDEDTTQELCKELGIEC